MTDQLRASPRSSSPNGVDGSADAVPGNSLEMFFFIRTVLLRRLGPVGLLLTAYDVWRRIPAARRRKLLAGGRRHGSRLAARFGR